MKRTFEFLFVKLSPCSLLCFCCQRTQILQDIFTSSFSKVSKWKSTFGNIKSFYSSSCDFSPTFRIYFLSRNNFSLKIIPFYAKATNLSMLAMFNCNLFVVIKYFEMSSTTHSVVQCMHAVWETSTLQRM